MARNNKSDSSILRAIKATKTCPTIGQSTCHKISKVFIPIWPSRCHQLTWSTPASEKPALRYPRLFWGLCHMAVKTGLSGSRRRRSAPLIGARLQRWNQYLGYGKFQGLVEIINRLILFRQIFIPMAVRRRLLPKHSKSIRPHGKMSWF